MDIRGCFQRLDPYELLFSAISVATLPHTAWALSSLFEGELRSDNTFQWHLTGFMLSIAIDVGMLISARLLAAKTTRLNKIVLIIAFVIAAFGSAYSQLIYLLIHGDAFIIPPFVPEYWRNALQPIIDARVVIIPALLPVLATIYAAARISSTRREENREFVSGEPPMPVVVSRPEPPIPVTALPTSETPLLEPGEIPEELVDWPSLKFFDPVSQQWKGPFPDRDTVIKRYNALQERRRKFGIPAYAAVIAKRKENE